MSVKSFNMVYSMEANAMKNTKKLEAVHTRAARNVNIDYIKICNPSYIINVLK